MKTDLQEIELLLRERLAVIANHELRDRDPSGHLEQLRAASTVLNREFQDQRGQLPPRLAHFMQQASYQKALEYIVELGKKPDTSGAV